MGKPRRPAEKKVLVSSDEEEAFSAEETENDGTSSDDDNAGSGKKRSRNKNSDSSDCEDEFFGKGKKPKKKKSKKSRGDDSDLDDPVMKKGSKRKLYKKDITLMTEQEIKDKYRYKKHKCALSDLPTKTKKPIGKSCRPGHPEDLKVESVKLHYVVHYKEFGYWDHIVPEEGDRAGKIDCYECQVCDKKFKNALEKQGPGSSAGRGSSICHVATDHGRLLEALLNEEKDMTSEIEFLAEHDKGFNDAYNEYFSNKKQLFGLPDDQIITSRESLVWKIYAKKPKEDEKNESPVPKKSPMKINQTSNIPLQRNESQKPLPIELGKLEKLECPFKDEFKCNLTNKQRTEHHDFRMHFFLHYRIFKIEDEDHWDERLKNLEKGDQLSMYCDLCPIRKRIKAATENGLRNSMICHLAVIHDELRDVMEKDSRISKDFIKAVYYDIDLKKLQASGAKIPSPQKSPPKVQQSENFAKNSPPKKAETNGYKPGPKSKTKKSKESLEEENSDNVDDPEDFDFPSDESDQDSAPKRKINNVTNGSASKKKSVTKSKPRSRKSSPTPMRENKNIIRKRKPINFTVDDLNDDEAEDENWKGSPKVQPKLGVEGKRVMPGRRSRQTPKKTYSESESD